MGPSISSLVWATDIDVLAPDHTLQRRDGYWVIQSPTNPTYWWGNFLLFDDPPGAGDGARWETLFAREFAAAPAVRHTTFAWDRTDGTAGAAAEELVARGFELERSSGLIATAEALQEPVAANREVEIRILDPAGDEPLWAAVLDVQMAGAPEEFRHSEYHRTFLRTRQQELRTLMRRGRGDWYVARLDGVVAGSLGIVVTGGRARFQSVDTVQRLRRRGVARRLVHAAAQLARSRYAIDHFVIVADPGYHAIGIYEALGFRRVETVLGALRRPDRRETNL